MDVNNIYRINLKDFIIKVNKKIMGKINKNDNNNNNNTINNTIIL